MPKLFMDSVVIDMIKCALRIALLQFRLQWLSANYYLFDFTQLLLSLIKVIIAASLAIGLEVNSV